MRLFGGGDEFITNIDLQNTSAGTNLLVGSKDWATNTAIYGSAHASDEKYLNGKIFALTGTGVRNSLQIQNLSLGTQIAWSVWAKSTGTAILHTEANGGAGSKDIKLGSNWTRVFSCGAPRGAGVVYFWNNTPDSEIDLCLPKIELGSIATQWCPAPEDIAWKSDIQYLKQTMLKCVPHVNLLRNSAGPFFPQAGPNNGDNTGQTDANAIDQFQAFLNSTVTLVKGETYTVSAATNGVFSNNHDPNNASNKCVIWIGPPINIVISGENVSTNTFTWNSDTGTYPLRVNRYGKDSTVKCWNVKIEHGNQATSWTPCPLDS